jgi:sialate O-acetylesterase
MRTFKLTIVALLIATLNAFSAGKKAEVKLPTLISQNMVLQQQSDVPVWGWSEPGAAVVVKPSWMKDKFNTTTNEKGKWMVKIPTPEAGGPYKIAISGLNEIILENVMIGEVWVCSGQSNMQQTLSGYFNQPTNQANELALHSKNSNIRYFHVERTSSGEALENCKGEWLEASPEYVLSFSAVAYTFGKKLNEVLDIPIGLIHTSWGGSTAEAWIDEEAMKEFESETETFSKQGNQKPENRNQAPSRLYNGMINPLLPYKIKGAIWYQGESNRNRPEQYTRLFPAMIRNWRSLWDCGDFPFYYVQIAPFRYKGGINSAFVREAQLKTMKNCVNTGMAVTMDIGEEFRIHPAEKKMVGDRLAYWALAQTYGIEGVVCSGPVYNAMEVIDGKILVKFDHAPSGLSTFGKELTNFIISGSDKKLYPAKARIVRGGVEVWSDEVEEPVAVRYGWSDWCVGSLYNTYGLPASSFRTDDWDE